MDALQRVTKSRVNLVLEEPFFGTLALRLKIKLEEGLITACTDGRSIAYDPAFVAKLSERQLNTVTVHEVLHCALLHHTRRGNRDPAWFNIAADHAVNWAIQKSMDGAPGVPGSKIFEWFKDPAPLKDPAFKDMCVEEIYARIYQPQPPKGKQGKDPGGMGGVTEPETDPGQSKRESANQSETEWQTAVLQAAQAAKFQGKLPSGFEQLIDELMKPQVSWQDVLRRFVSVHARDDWSWTRPNRRMAATTGIYLPGLYSQRCGHLIFCLDTSGSCWGAQPTFLSEVQAVLDEVRPERLTLIDIDADVGQVREFSPGDLIPKEVKGCGGTDFRPAFDWVTAQGENPLALVYLTDLYGTFPETSPDYPVLWIATSDLDVPWGEVVRITE